LSRPWILAFLVLSVYALVLGLVLLGVMRRLRPLLGSEGPLAKQEVLDGLPLGMSLPPLALGAAEGEAFSLATLAGEPFLLLLLMPGCGPCRSLVEDLVQHEGELAAQILAIVEGSGGSDRFPLPADIRVFHEDDGAASRELQVNTFPFAFAVDESFTIVGRNTVSLDELKKLDETLTRRTAEPALLQVSPNR
jgi:hypothetical protein